MDRMNVVFENENRDPLYHSRVLQEVRQRYPESFVVMIHAGFFTAAGDLIVPSCRIRSEAYRKQGADLILSLPVASSLGGYGQKEFAQAALVQRLRISERIIIPCVPSAGQSLKDCEDVLRSCAMLMLQEPGDYRSRLKGYRDQNLPFREAQVKTVCDAIPEAGALLCCPENRAALWQLFAFLQLYYLPHVEFIHAPSPAAGPAPDSDSANEVTFDQVHEAAQEAAHEATHVAAHEAALEMSLDPSSMQDDLRHFENVSAAKIKEFLSSWTLEKLIDISGSTEQMAETLIQKKEEIQSLDSLQQISQLLLPGSLERIQLFLLRAILGVRKIDMQICGLHEYVPYCKIDAENPQKSTRVRQMSEETWVPFTGAHDPDQKVRENYQYLLRIDEMANALYD